VNGVRKNSRNKLLTRPEAGWILLHESWSDRKG
jgi:hypothetical protein